MAKVFQSAGGISPAMSKCTKRWNQVSYEWLWLKPASWLGVQKMRAVDAFVYRFEEGLFDFAFF
jgi:hypothetical protein